ncbi:MAG TPA: hypothetical protein VL651_17265 [Bacteroidia bacterium]|jgi:hypothetical protein|nr:hypothetical protein [Bacteroidia bacterium]
MKKFIAILFFITAVISMNAQTPSSVFRDWQNDPVIARQNEQRGQFESWEIYYNSSTAATLSFIRGGRQVPVYSDYREWATNDPLPEPYSTPSSSEMWRTEIPHSAYFCRMEQYTSFNYGVMLSIHTGGFSETDEIDQH